MTVLPTADVENAQDELATAEQILRASPEDATALYLSAVALRRLGRPDEALARLRTLAGLAVIDAEDQVLVAAEFLELEERDLAREAAEAAERLGLQQPLPEESAMNLASVWFTLGERARALAVLGPQLAREGPPTPADALVTEIAAAHSLFGDDDPAGAEELIRRLERRGADLTEYPALRLWLGVALVHLQRFTEALPLLDADLPDLVNERHRGEALLGRGTALLETGSADALEVLAQAAPLLEGGRAAFAELLQTLALLAAQRGVEGREAIDRAAQHTTPSTDPVLRGRIALWQAVTAGDDDERFTEAARLADELLPSEWPERGTLTLIQAQRLATSEPNQAIALLDTLPTQPAALRTRATALAARGDPREAARALEPLLNAEDATADRLRHATLLLQTGDADDAAAARTEFAGIADADLSDPRAARSYVELVADALGRLGGSDETLESVLVRLTTPATAVVTDFLRMGSLMLRGELAAAMELLHAHADPDAEERDPLAWLVAAQARQLDNRTDASAAVEKAIALEPRLADHPNVRLVRLLEAARTGDVAAVDDIDPHADTPESRLFHGLARGMALTTAQRSDEAIAALTAAAAEGARLTSPMARQWRAQALGQKAMLLVARDRLKDADEALTAAETAAADLPEGNVVQLQLALVKGLLRMRHGRHTEADAALATVGPTERMPEQFAFVYEYMRGANWHLAGRDAAEDALGWLGKAVQRRPDDVDILDLLGSVHLDLEDPAAALTCFDRAREIGRKPDQLGQLLRDSARAHRMLGQFEKALVTAREAVAHDDTDARNWMSVGLAQLGLGRNDAAAIAFRRGRQMRSSPTAQVEQKLVVGLTTALIEGGHADEAARILGTAEMRKKAADEPQLAQNHAVALHRTNRWAEAATALRRAGQTQQADDLAAAHNQPHSWLGFWFGSGVSVGRAALGVALMVLAAVTLGLVVVDAGRVEWLPWVATDTPRLLAPLVLVVVLFLLPVLTKIKLGDIELEQPAPVTPADAELHTVNWEAIERQVAKVSASTPTGTLPAAETSTGRSSSLDRSGIAEAAARSAGRPPSSP